MGLLVLLALPHVAESTTVYLYTVFEKLLVRLQRSTLTFFCNSSEKKIKFIQKQREINWFAVHAGESDSHKYSTKPSYLHILQILMTDIPLYERYISKTISTSIDYHAIQLSKTWCFHLFPPPATSKGKEYIQIT